MNAEEGFQEYLYSIDSHTALQMIRPAFKKEYVPENELVLRNQMIEKREQENAERKEKEHDGTTV